MEEKRGFGKLSLEIISDFNKWILLTVLNAKFLVVLIAPLKKKIHLCQISPYLIRVIAF